MTRHAVLAGGVLVGVVAAWGAQAGVEPVGAVPAGALPAGAATTGATPATTSSVDLAAARKLQEEGKSAEAKAALEAIASRDPKNAEALFLLGRIALASQDYDGAVRWLGKAVALRPDSSTDHMWLGRAYAQKAIQASVLRRPFIAPSVKREMLKAVELDPDNIDARFDLARFYILAPGIMGGSAEKAMQQAAEIKKRDSLQGRQCYAMIYEEQDKPDLAEQEYVSAVREAPGDRRARLWLGIFYQGRGKHDQAFEILEALARLDPPENAAYYQIGKTAILSGRNLDRGEECFRIYLQKDPKEGDPSRAWAHFRLGNLYEKKGSHDLARRAYSEALRLQADHREAKTALARLR